ncbi:MAG: sialidase family protein, partial [Acidimicrobiales bacterium]
SAGDNTAVTSAGDGLAAWSSPAFVANPTNAEQLVVAGRLDRPQLGAGLRRSTDGGKAWSDVALPLPAGESRAFAPDAAFDAAGGLYVTYVTLSDPANNPTGLWLARSSDGGASFAAPTKVAGPYGFQPRVVVSGSNVHVSFVQASAAVESLHNGFGPPPNPVVMASSADGGTSFAAPVAVSDPARPRVGAATPVVGSGGAVYVLYSDYGDDAVDLEGQPGPTHAGRFSLVLARSADGAQRFDTLGVVDDALVPTGRFNPYTPAYASLAVDTAAPDNDVLYVAWSDARGGDADVFVRRSTDEGASWAAPVRVNADDEADQYLPVASVAPSGRVDVAYLDRSADARNTLATAALATSFDIGDTWSTLVVSDTSFDSGVGPEAVGGGTDPGSRIGLISRADSALAVWTDTRNGNADSGRTDLFFAPIRIVPET